MNDAEFDRRARTRELAAEFNEKGEPLGWFDALYKEAAGDSEKVPWADMEPNRFFREFRRRALAEGADAELIEDVIAGYRPEVIEYLGTQESDARLGKPRPLERYF